MKFQRHVKMTTAQLDVTPFAGVFFCLLIFILLAQLVYTPGVQIELPVSREPGTGVDGPVVSIALDPNGQYYMGNQIISEADLFVRLQSEVAHESAPMTLYVAADKNVTLAQISHLRDVAAKAGMKYFSQGFMPGPFDAPSGAGAKKQ